MYTKLWEIALFTFSCDWHYTDRFLFTGSASVEQIHFVTENFITARKGFIDTVSLWCYLWMSHIQKIFVKMRSFSGPCILEH